MQHKISSCYVVSKNAWAKYRKRYRKQWEHDPLFQGLCKVITQHTVQFSSRVRELSEFFSKFYVVSSTLLAHNWPLVVKIQNLHAVTTALVFLSRPAMLKCDLRIRSADRLSITSQYHVKTNSHRIMQFFRDSSLLRSQGPRILTLETPPGRTLHKHVSVLSMLTAQRQTASVCFFSDDAHQVMLLLAADYSRCHWCRVWSVISSYLLLLLAVRVAAAFWHVVFLLAACFTVLSSRSYVVPFSILKIVNKID